MVLKWLRRFLKKHPLPRLGKKKIRLRPILRKAHAFIRTPKGYAVTGAVIFLLAAGVVLAQTLFAGLPSPKKLASQAYPVSTQIFDRHGQLLYEIYADTHRTPVTLASLPAYVKQATIAIEDQNFYHHVGFSIEGIIRAAKNTLFRDKLQGGSTITQQLVKTALLTPERTLKRKIREAVLTVGTEILYTKDQILEMYLNHIPYGGTAYGVEAAAQRYFGKKSGDLSLGQAALLVGLPQAPSRYSPFINPDQAKARQHQVLRRMVEDNYITQAQADQAFAEPLNYAPPATDIKAPHFVMYIKNLLEAQYGLETVERGGLRVITSLDLNLQNYAQSSVSAEVADLNRYRVQNGAALVTKPDTGEILAMIGSVDYFNIDNDGQVNLTNRLRQPGSSIKPINYVTAFQTKRLTPASVLIDLPTCFKVANQPLYCPKNYDGSFHGLVSVRQSLANSYNIPAVKTLALNGLDSMIATASAMGIRSFTDTTRYGLSLTLGGGEVTMLDMATAFGTLANQGVRVNLHPILQVSDYRGNHLFSYNPEAAAQQLATFFNPENPESNQLGLKVGELERVLNREPAYLISDILADNRARSAAFGPNSQLVIKQKTVSVKTGTTNDLKDNWTIGYTPHFLVAAWVGNNDATPMNPYLVSGVTGAAPIWNDIMSHLLSDQPDDPPPEPQNIQKINVCRETGSHTVAGVSCETRNDLFWSENTPKSASVTKKNIWVDKTTGSPAFIAGSDRNAAPVDLTNLELQEHTLASDALVIDFCVDCAWPLDDKGHAQYPRMVVDMTTAFTPAQGSQSELPPQP